MLCVNSQCHCCSVTKLDFIIISRSRSVNIIMGYGSILILAILRLINKVYAYNIKYKLPILQFMCNWILLLGINKK